MSDRVRFRRNLSAEFLDKLRARFVEMGGSHGEIVVGLVDELAHCYEAILAPGYGFESEMDRFHAYVAMGERLAAELRDTRATLAAATHAGEVLARELAEALAPHASHLTAEAPGGTAADRSHALQHHLSESEPP